MGKWEFDNLTISLIILTISVVVADVPNESTDCKIWQYKYDVDVQISDKRALVLIKNCSQYLLLINKTAQCSIPPTNRTTYLGTSFEFVSRGCDIVKQNHVV